MRPTLLPLVAAAALLAACGGSSTEEVAASDPPTAEAAASLPGSSLYQLDHVLTDHRGARLPLAELRGDPVVLVFFYATCDTACPMLLGDGKRLAEALPQELRERTRFLYLSIDPERDTVERLAGYAEVRGGLEDGWHLARTSATATRELAAVVGVQYRATADGHFAHSNLLTVLDAEGRIIGQVEGLQQPVDRLVEALVEAGGGA